MESSHKTFAQKAIDYFINLQPPQNLSAGSAGIEVLNPYKSSDVKRITSEFYKSFFNDNNKRFFILGINPGRFGGGVTGIAFTDPIALVKSCGIKNSFIKKPELSSKFVYSFINEFGGVKKFYSKFYVGAVFPLALIKDGKNYNYYENKDLYHHLKPYIISSLKKQINFGAINTSALCLGRKNFVYLNELNNELSYFNSIITLEHPRYIMQYRLKVKHLYIKKYLEVFRSLKT